MNNKKWLHPPPEKFYSHPEQSRNDLDPFKVTELATPFAVLVVGFVLGTAALVGEAIRARGEREAGRRRGDI